MRLTLSDKPSYWHAGGSVMMPGGELPLSEAPDFVGTLGRLALDAEARGDALGARFCARQAVDLFKAIRRAAEHRCAATGIARSASPLADFLGWA